ncbi:ABC transporter permease [Spirosoma rigui]|uniref:ABC transporter permease n=1 Tax=Spirosoma rigui TaxID=564064 RepID=UPI001C54CA82|nr:ABC transporter permease [Spirosoma rigui]
MKRPAYTPPPRWATTLLRRWGHPDTAEEVQGDLLELYHYWRQTVGQREANWRYIVSALKLLRPLARRKPSDYPSSYILNANMLRTYLTLGIRNLVKNRVYSAINIGGLALGIACCLLISLYVYDEFSYDRFNTHYKHIYRIIERQKQADGIFDVAVTPGPLAAAIAKDFPEVALTTRVGRWHGSLSQGRHLIEPEQFLIVDPSFFSLFTFPLVVGDTSTIFRGPNEVIFSEAAAERFFGTDWKQQHVLGQTITFNNEQPLKLVGIAKNPPVQSHIQFDVLIPFKWLERNYEWSMKWNSNSYHTYVQLRPDPSGEPANPAAFGHKIREQLSRYDSGNKTPLLLQPLSAIYLYSSFAFQTDYGKRSDIAYIHIFVSVGLIVLLIAVINFINLATARASQRAKEVGVRKSVGAQRSSLIAQFLGEAFLMTSLSVLSALLLAELLLPIFNELAARASRIPYHLPVFWAILLGITVVVSLLAGLYPAFVLSSFQPVSVLKTGIAGHFSRVHTGRRFRQSLVVGQFVLSITLAISTIVIYRQLTFMQTTKLGFDKSHLLYVSLKGNLRGKALAFKEAVSQLPGVDQVSVATSNLVDMSNGTNIEWEGQFPKDAFSITQMNIDADFIRTTGMSMAAGRNFSAQITSDTAAALGTYLVNETAAKRMGWTPTRALGKRVKVWGTDGTIIGVVNDFHFQPLRVRIEPFIFRFRPKEFYFTLLIKTNPNLLPRTLAEVSGIYKKMDPGTALSYGFVDQDLDRQYQSEQRIGRIIFCFAILTILVSCLGLLGLTAFTAEQRTKEIGIRKVLGASVAGIVALLSRDFLKLMLLAVVLASPLAWYAMSYWLHHFAYKTRFEWWMPALAGLLAIGIALLTISFQSIKAALANPVRSLRNE